MFMVMRTLIGWDYNRGRDEYTVFETDLRNSTNSDDTHVVTGMYMGNPTG